MVKLRLHAVAVGCSPLQSRGFTPITRVHTRRRELHDSTGDCAMSTRSSTSSSSRLERLWNERANAEPPQTHRPERCDSQNCGIAWQNTSPPSVKPAMWNASSSTSVAVLFRGQAWRWGCQTAPQRHLQSLCWQAYARTLQSTEHSVWTELTLGGSVYAQYTLAVEVQKRVTPSVGKYYCLRVV